MNRSALVRTLAGTVVTSLLFAGMATAASAAETATINFDTPQVLTLPAGDGVRDTTTVNVWSDVPTVVSFAIYNGDTLVKDLAPVTLTSEALVSTVVIPVSGLPAGALTLVASPELGSSKAETLTVGSGQPSTVTTTLSASKIYTWSKATPRSTTASVTAVDETGFRVPFTGTVTAAVGGKTYKAAVKSTTGAPAKASISVTKLAAGTGSVKATVRALKTGSSTYTSPAVTLKVLKTAVTALKLSANYTTVFPAADSYRDTVTIKLTPTTSTGKSFASTGTVKITRNGKTIKSWKLTSSAAKSFAWNGKVGTKIVPGTYTVTATLKGPEGATKTTKMYIKVDKRKLVTTTKTLTYKGWSVFSLWEAYDGGGDGVCWTDPDRAGIWSCDSFGDLGDPEYTLLTTGTVTVPSYVLSAQQYGATYAAVTLETGYWKSGITGGTPSAAWSYDNMQLGVTKFGEVAMGKKSLGNLKLTKGTTKVHITVGLRENTQWDANSVTVKYTYKVLK